MYPGVMYYYLQALRKVGGEDVSLAIHDESTEPATEVVTMETGVSCQTDITVNDISALEETKRKYYTNVFMQTRPKSIPMNFHQSLFQKDDSNISYYTGLPNYNVIVTIFSFVKGNIEAGVCLQLFEEFIIMLCKFGFNLGLKDIVIHCGVTAYKY